MKVIKNISVWLLFIWYKLYDGLGTLWNKIQYTAYKSIKELPKQRHHDLLQTGDLRFLVKRRWFVKLPSYQKADLKNITFLAKPHFNMKKEFVDIFGYPDKYLQDIELETSISEMEIELWIKEDQSMRTIINIYREKLRISREGKTDNENLIAEAAMVATGLGQPIFNLNVMSVFEYHSLVLQHNKNAKEQNAK